MTIGPLEVLLVLFLLAWLVPSYFVARFARDRGQNFWLFLLLAVVVSWVLALVVALLIPDKREQVVAPPLAADPDLERLRNLADLHARGALTDDEFAAQKAALLSGSRAGS